jgi:hypothetical protein
MPGHRGSAERHPDTAFDNSRRNEIGFIPQEFGASASLADNVVSRNKMSCAESKESRTTA